MINVVKVVAEYTPLNLIARKQGGVKFTRGEAMFIFSCTLLDRKDTLHLHILEAGIISPRR